MTTHALLSRLIAFLIFAALASAPFGDAMAATRAMEPSMNALDMAEMPMSGMPMAGMTEPDGAGAMPCCPDAAPEPATDCDKSACPSMAACTQQCMPASVFADADGIGSVGRGDVGLPRIFDLLASRVSEPPARPPRT